MLAQSQDQTVFGVMSPEGEVTTRTIDAQALAVAVDGKREIALVSNYETNPLALLVDDEVIPIPLAIPGRPVMLSVDGDDIVFWVGSVLVRVRGTGSDHE